MIPHADVFYRVSSSVYISGLALFLEERRNNRFILQFRPYRTSPPMFSLLRLPHIMDRILEYSDYTVLFACHQTCRDLREFIDRILARRALIQVDLGPRDHPEERCLLHQWHRMGFFCHAEHHGLVSLPGITSSHTCCEEPHALTRFYSVLQHTRALDTFDFYPLADMGHLPEAAPHIKTLRISASSF